MKILELKEISDRTLLFPADSNGREIFIYELNYCRLVGKSTYYPNVILFSGNKCYNPIKEKIMSLEKVNQTNDAIVFEPEGKETENNPVFFFIYNTDNYFHWVYDSLSYLITYKKLKEKTPNLKLLMNYPNHQAVKFYRFVMEFLELLDISQSDILIANNETVYEKVFVSTSYTHAFNSNLPPREEIFGLCKDLVNKARNKFDHSRITSLPKKLYISRRTHLHKDFSNIGTNYTSRRKLENEDELVKYLISKGYTEIFTENLSTIEKIVLFNNATHIVGALGGGLCNVVFSKPDCKLFAINSPGFLDTNFRFSHCFSYVDWFIFNNTRHVENRKFKKYQRVKYQDIIGEISDIDRDTLTISYTIEPVAGWSSSMIYKTINVNSKDCITLDDGLNSEWEMNLWEFKRLKI